MTPSRNRVTLAALALAQISGAAAAGVSLTASAIAVTHLAGSATPAGLAQTVTIVGAGAASIPLARLASRRGRRSSLRVAYLIALAGGLTAAWGAALGVLGLFLVGLVGVGSGTAAGLALRFAAADLAADPARRPQYIALILWVASVGSFAGPQLATSSLSSGMAAAPFLAIAGLYAVSLLILSLIRAPVLEKVHPVSAPVGPPPAGCRIPAAAWNAIVVSTSTHVAMTGLMGMAPVFLTERGVGIETVAAIMSAHLVGMYVASPLFGLLVRVTRHRTAWVAALTCILAACVVIAMSTQSAVSFGFGLTLLGLGWSLSMVASSAGLAGVPPASRLRAQGMADTFLNIGGALGSLLAGLVVGLAGYPTLVRLVAVLVAATLFVPGIDLLRSRSAHREEAMLRSKIESGQAD